MSNLTDHPHIKELKLLDNQYPDRNEFHEKVKPLLLKMGNDKAFLKLIVIRNFDDAGYLNQKWSGYNIPFFYIFESDTINLKMHLFPAEEKNRNNIAAHCIHHHNNYILTTNAFFGSGYETMLFERKPEVDANLEVNLKISKHFHQKDINPSTINSWEPHVVFIPETLSATIALWTPDKKRVSDSLRTNFLIKSLKKPLRWLIHKLNLSENIGIANEVIYQFYPSGNTFKGIEESVYFELTKAEKGITVDNYSAQMIFSFIQRCEIGDINYLTSLKTKKLVPEYYHKWIDMILNNEPIPDVYHRTELNIPSKTYFKEDILKASS